MYRQQLHMSSKITYVYGMTPFSTLYGRCCIPTTMPYGMQTASNTYRTGANVIALSYSQPRFP